MNTKDFIKSLTGEQLLAFEALKYDIRLETKKEIKQKIVNLRDNQFQGIKGLYSNNVFRCVINVLSEV